MLLSLELLSKISLIFICEADIRTTINDVYLTTAICHRTLIKLTNYRRSLLLIFQTKIIV